MHQRGTWMIVWRQLGDVGNGGAHGSQELGQTELGMAMGVVGVVQQSGVVIRAHGTIEAGQHHSAARQIVDGPEQARRGGNGAGGTCRDDGAIAIDQRRCQGLSVEALAAQKGGIGFLAVEPQWPIGQRDIKKGQGLLPVFAQIGLDLGDDGTDLGGTPLFGVQIIDQQAQRLGH